MRKGIAKKGIAIVLSAAMIGLTIPTNTFAEEVKICEHTGVDNFDAK